MEFFTWYLILIQIHKHIISVKKNKKKNQTIFGKHLVLDAIGRKCFFVFAPEPLFVFPFGILAGFCCLFQWEQTNTSSVKFEPSTKKKI